MNKRHAVHEYHIENSQLDVYHGSTYTPTTDVLCAMTGSKNLRAPHDWPNTSVRTWDDNGSICSMFEMRRAQP